jgi:large exoprotein involved in heme utilization and adhesion
MIYLDQAEITTSVESGVGGGGNIDIDPDFVILKQSSILANAFGGPGGNINIVAGNFIATPDSVVDASSALGIDGIVNISSPDEEISKELAVLPDTFLDVTSLISERCGTAAGTSSLVNAGPGGLVVDPDGYLPSFATTNLDNKQKEKGGNESAGKTRWWAPYSHRSALHIAELTCLR